MIPPDQLLPLVLCKGPSGVDLEFSYQTRDREKLVRPLALILVTSVHFRSVQIEELGRALVNLSSIVPGGIVCFFPSYEYERKVHAHWDKTGILNRIGQKKKVSSEKRSWSEEGMVVSDDDD